MTIGEATGLFGLLRELLLDRPSVKAIAFFKDYGPVVPGFITSHVGKCVGIEVHCTGQAPVRVTSIGFELTNGHVVELENGDGLPTVLNRPQACDRWTYRESLLSQLAEMGPNVRLKRIRVAVSPDHVIRRRLPKGWTRFPESDPPLARELPLHNLRG